MVSFFSFTKTNIPGLIEIQPFCSEDARGYFIKDYSKEVFEQNGINHDLKEVFYSKSGKGVIRGLHFQREKQQAKLVRCLMGSIYDVVIDLRKESSYFSRWLSFHLSEENKHEILVPVGCAHGYLVLEDSIVSYKCSEKFHAELDDGIRWNDPDIGVPWPIEMAGHEIILSEKDKNLQTFSQFMEKYGGF